VNECRSLVPHDDKFPDAGTVSHLLDSAESFVSTWAHTDKLFDSSGVPIYDVTTKSVKMSADSKKILDAYREAGFANMGSSGLGLPYVVQCAISSITSSAFTSQVLGHFVLTQCAGNLLLAHGSQELVDLYHEKLITGDYFGTMALSETQAGSSLQHITTKATDSNDGSFAITGTKMWTSGADHDLTDNIIHMLLAKIDGSDKISLFLVPKFLQDGTRNSYEINGLNHKMGNRAVSNCYWSLENATGYLVGEADKVRG